MSEQNVESLKLHQNPLVYFVVIALMSLIAVIYNAFYHVFSQDVYIFFIIIFAFSFTFAYLIYETRCPNCKRIFVRNEVKKEKIGEEVRPYTYHDKIRYLYSDGTLKEEVDGQAHTIDEKWAVYRHHYNCKKCHNEWSKDKNKNLDEGKRPTPKVKTVKTKESNSLNGDFGLGDWGDDEKPKKRRIAISAKIKRQVFERAENACQMCGKNNVKLHIHHIDNDPSNNRMGNLIVLCPNHHSQADSINRMALKNHAKKHYKKEKVVNIYK